MGKSFPGSQCTKDAEDKDTERDFPDAPVVKILPARAGSAGSIADQGYFLLNIHEGISSWPKNKECNRRNIVTNSIQTFKMVHIKKKIFK